MKATGYVGDAFPGMTFRLQLPLLPIMVNTSFFSVALPNLCCCCFQGTRFFRKHSWNYFEIVCGCWWVSFYLDVMLQQLLWYSAIMMLLLRMVIWSIHPSTLSKCNPRHHSAPPLPFILSVSCIDTDWHISDIRAITFAPVTHFKCISD